MTADGGAAQDVVAAATTAVAEVPLGYPSGMIYFELMGAGIIIRL
eukprot:CAMPEP_0178519486 /NCGR_PEP_ID=MMETSP0696-20121128/26855_1 /TAXON_ID=265572 /ORGANISM="Extubocellulus spinifer, Strain CCMP396" /LENGTH=44 /DNA_ID= /DNA_START= /DNA_END= /DNA_ORIENTATION=